LQFCKGKKTLVFTQNTNLNNLLYNQFVEHGIENTLMYYSINETEYNRSEKVDIFRDNK
jgi:hypothetical protein